MQHPLSFALPPVAEPAALYLSTEKTDLLISETSSFAWVFDFRLGLRALFVDLRGREAPWPRPENPYVRLAEWGYIALKASDELQTNDIVLYGDMEHVALVISPSLMESRWGGVVFRHAIQAVPARFGPKALAMRRVDLRMPERVRALIG